MFYLFCLIVSIVLLSIEIRSHYRSEIQSDESDLLNFVEKFLFQYTGL
jgi:hypothetical protein